MNTDDFKIYRPFDFLFLEREICIMLTGIFFLIITFSQLNLVLYHIIITHWIVALKRTYLQLHTS